MNHCCVSFLTHGLEVRKRLLGQRARAPVILWDVTKWFPIRACALCNLSPGEARRLCPGHGALPSTRLPGFPRPGGCFILRGCGDPPLGQPHLPQPQGGTTFSLQKPGGAVSPGSQIQSLPAGRLSTWRGSLLTERLGVQLPLALLPPSNHTHFAHPNPPIPGPRPRASLPLLSLPLQLGVTSEKGCLPHTLKSPPRAVPRPDCWGLGLLGQFHGQTDT